MSAPTARRATGRSDALMFDADAARAARREAVGAPFDFRWQGQVLSVAPTREWPIGVTSLLAEGKLVDALRLLLGPDQFAQYMEGLPTMGDVEDLMTAMGKVQGLTLPQ
jgi:hypothetical protein